MRIDFKVLDEGRQNIILNLLILFIRDLNFNVLVYVGGGGFNSLFGLIEIWI